MLRRLWLLFAQATTIGLALLFVVGTLRPDWLRRNPIGAIAPLREIAIQQAAPAGRAELNGSFASAAKRAMPAVVSVYTTKEVRASSGNPLFDHFFGPQGQPQTERVSSLGSGVIATADGYVVTNHHVVQAADEILVALQDGRRFDAKLIGADPDTDLAVLKIDAPTLPVITFGKAEALAVGDVVLAIGNPFDVGQTVTMGIVSALGRKNLGINRLESFIQTDAAINQGNSGGALVDASGNLVGINSALYSSTGGSVGIGFAIPTTIVTQVMGQLIKTGKVVRGYFGIEPVDITAEMVEALKLARSEGVVVRGVERSAPAGVAGIAPGDVIVRINGTAVRSTGEMLNLVAQLAPGSVAKVNLMRGSKELTVDVTVGERPVQPPRK